MINKYSLIDQLSLIVHSKEFKWNLELLVKHGNILTKYDYDEIHILDETVSQNTFFKNVVGFKMFGKLHVFHVIKKFYYFLKIDFDGRLYQIGLFKNVSKNIFFETAV